MDSTKPASRSTRRCLDTIGCGMPSCRSISPTDCCDKTSRLRIARRFGSAMISNTDSMLCVYSTEHIRVKVYLGGKTRATVSVGVRGRTVVTQRVHHRRQRIGLRARVSFASLAATVIHADGEPASRSIPGQPEIIRTRSAAMTVRYRGRLHILVSL